MQVILDQVAPVLAISCAGVFFMSALLTGFWKFSCMMASGECKAPYYVDIAHRASLMYAYGALLVAVFAYFSIFSSFVNTLATMALMLFFSLAIVKYIVLGRANKTNNQFRDSENPRADRKLLVIVGLSETLGFAVLLLGFALGLIRAD
ncbi:hypothetical protein A9Q90_05185 [Gammaproteobacteria bacterium 54_18_T64]|nr:hypothetical protein A9Q90_05185 [Gammaproteobacteria bacterium 54_18_T64]